MNIKNILIMENTIKELKELNEQYIDQFIAMEQIINEQKIKIAELEKNIAIMHRNQCIKIAQLEDIIAIEGKKYRELESEYRHNNFLLHISEKYKYIVLCKEYNILHNP